MGDQIGGAWRGLTDPIAKLTGNIPVVSNLAMGPGAGQLPMDDQLLRLAMTYAVARFAPSSLPNLYASYGEQSNNITAARGTYEYQSAIAQRMLPKEEGGLGESQSTAIKNVDRAFGLRSTGPPGGLLPPLSAKQEVEGITAEADRTRLTEAAQGATGNPLLDSLAWKRAVGQASAITPEELQAEATASGAVPTGGSVTAGRGPSVTFQLPRERLRPRGPGQGPVAQGAPPGSAPEAPVAMGSPENVQSFIEENDRAALAASGSGAPVSDSYPVVNRETGQVEWIRRTPEDLDALQKQKDQADKENQVQVRSMFHKTKTRQEQLDAIAEYIRPYATREAFPMDQPAQGFMASQKYRFEQWGKQYAGSSWSKSAPLHAFIDRLRAAASGLAEVFEPGARPTDEDVQRFIAAVWQPGDTYQQVLKKIDDLPAVVDQLAQQRAQAAGVPFTGGGGGGSTAPAPQRQGTAPEGKSLKDRLRDRLGQGQ